MILRLRRLIEAARERGIKSFYCDVLSSNQAMRGMILEAAPDAVIRGGEGQEVLTVEVPLDALAAKLEGAHQPLGRLLSMVAEGLVRVRQVFRREAARSAT